jgi:hypothetical protein
MNFISFFEEQIKIQEQAIRSFKWWIAGLVLSGIGIILIASLLDITQNIKSDLIKIAGFFVAALAAFPYKEIAPRRERIAFYKCLKHNFEETRDSSSNDRQMLMQLAIDAMKETMKR